MKHFLKIKNSKWFPGSNKKKIYEDEEGDLFLGPPINHVIGETIIVEISDGPIEGYYHIIRLVGKIPPKK